MKRTIFVLILMSLSLLFNVILFKLYKKTDNELGIEKNNRIAYESLVNETQADNRVLRLKLSDLRHSYDKSVQTIDSVRKVLNIKDKELKQASLNKTEIHDTTVVKVEVKNDCSFNTVIKHNDLTISTISMDSIGNLTEILDINNDQYIYIYRRKEYRNKYRNKKFSDFWIRLFHFDFKKDEIYRHEQFNTNDLIETKETRLIVIDE
nr:MAG TPA: hypothetical protein [Caudoviricetes sp.]